MEAKITSSPNFVIRPLQSYAEVENFFLLNAEVFRRHDDVATIAIKYRQFITEAPHFRPDQLRGAFLGSTYLGGYFIPKLVVCMGSTQLDISGIGEVMIFQIFWPSTNVFTDHIQVALSAHINSRDISWITNYTF